MGCGGVGAGDGLDGGGQGPDVNLDVSALLVSQVVHGPPFRLIGCGSPWRPGARQGPAMTVCGWPGRERAQCGCGARECHARHRTVLAWCDRAGRRVRAPPAAVRSLSGAVRAFRAGSRWTLKPAESRECEAAVAFRRCYSTGSPCGSRWYSPRGPGQGRKPSARWRMSAASWVPPMATTKLVPFYMATDP